MEAHNHQELLLEEVDDCCYLSPPLLPLNLRSRVLSEMFVEMRSPPQVYFVEYDLGAYALQKASIFGMYRSWSLLPWLRVCIHN
jgi:hypothetical protein